MLLLHLCSLTGLPAPPGPGAVMRELPPVYMRIPNRAACSLYCGQEECCCSRSLLHPTKKGIKVHLICIPCAGVLDRVGAPEGSPGAIRPDGLCFARVFSAIPMLLHLDHKYTGFLLMERRGEMV